MLTDEALYPLPKSVGKEQNGEPRYCQKNKESLQLKRSRGAAAGDNLRQDADEKQVAAD